MDVNILYLLIFIHHFFIASTRVFFGFVCMMVIHVDFISYITAIIDYLLFLHDTVFQMKEEKC